MKNKKYQFEIEENNVIRAAIAPMGIDFRPNTVFIWVTTSAVSMR